MKVQSFTANFTVFTRIFQQFSLTHGKNIEKNRLFKYRLRTTIAGRDFWTKSVCTEKRLQKKKKDNNNKHRRKTHRRFAPVGTI